MSNESQPLPIGSEIQQVHITEISIGDTIVCRDGNLRTVGKGNIKIGSMRRTIFGDSYNLGTLLVTKVLFQSQTKKKVQP